MDPNIIVCIVTGVATVIAVIITNNKGNKEMDEKLESRIKVIDSRLENITEVLNKQSKLTDKVPLMEEAISKLEKQIEELRSVTDQVPAILDKITEIENQLIEIKTAFDLLDNNKEKE